MTKRVFDWSEIRRYLPTKIALSERLPPGIRGELLRPKVALAMPKGAGYVGTYAPIQLKLDPASGLTLDDLDFVVTSGAAGGMVSRSQERSAVASRPTVLLLHGYQPGVHVLEVRHHGSGVVLARRKFTVTDQWADDVNGPNLWFSGTVDTPTVAPTWGGGPGTAQNFATVLGEVWPKVEAQLLQDDQPGLLVNLGLAARWQKMPLFAKLADACMFGNRPPLIALIASPLTPDNRPVLDGEAVPVTINTTDYGRIPRAWLENAHRTHGSPTAATSTKSKQP